MMFISLDYLSLYGLTNKLFSTCLTFALVKFNTASVPVAAYSSMTINCFGSLPYSAIAIIVTGVC